MILIKNGWIVENNKLVGKDLLIDENLISDIRKNITENNFCQVLDATGCVIIPGVTDVHVHLREPGFASKETVRTGTLAASKGGVTSIMSMPNLKPCPDSLEHLKLQLDIIEKDAVVNVYPYGALSIDEMSLELADIDNIHDLVYGISDDGRGVNNISLLEEAMKKAKKYNLTIASHAEDDKWGLDRKGEYVAVEREIELAKKIGCKYHFCHLSVKESFEAIRKAQKDGYTNITCEVTPHHLVLNEEDIVDANFKMNPPLRSVSDQKETIKALLDGTASVIASDHAPHTENEKAQEYAKCPNGILGLETMVPIIYTHFVKENLIGWDRFIDLFITNPRHIFNLPTRALNVGNVADIAVMDISNKHVFKKEEILSKSKNSPFIGKEYYGFIKYTLVNGQVVYKE